MPVVDSFPARLRGAMEGVYENGLDELVEAGGGRAALEARVKSLTAEVQQVGGGDGGGGGGSGGGGVQLRQRPRYLHPSLAPVAAAARAAVVTAARYHSFPLDTHMSAHTHTHSHTNTRTCAGGAAAAQVQHHSQHTRQHTPHLPSARPNSSSAF